MKHCRNILLIVVVLAACTRQLPSINVDGRGVALKGYDTVAYFTDGRPVEGREEFAASWGGATWLFASAEHRGMFEADPERYSPRYGGY